MNKNLIIFGVAVLLFCVGLSGCEEIDFESTPDYKYVSVSATARVGTETVGIPNMAIEILILKDGVEQKDCLYLSNYDGKTDACSCLVKVYKEQEVTVVGNLNSVLPQQYLDEGYSVYGYQNQYLAWNTWWHSTEWGDTFGWTPELYFEVSFT